jgi:uncharacterized OB-fold protein
MEYLKPIPFPDTTSQTFWENARAHKLVLQQCSGCGACQFFPQPCCRKCLSEKLQWFEANGKGKIYSFTIIHRPPSHAFEADVPYIVAIVELEEGPRLMSNIIGIPSDDVRVDMPVEVSFDDISPTVSLPKFRPAGA